MRNRWLRKVTPKALMDLSERMFNPDHKSSLDDNWMYEALANELMEGGYSEIGDVEEAIIAFYDAAMEFDAEQVATRIEDLKNVQTQRLQSAYYQEYKVRIERGVFLTHTGIIRYCYQLAKECM